MVLLKIRLGDDVRRVTLADPSIDQLRRTVVNLYPTAPDHFQLRYQDDDGDMITLKVRYTSRVFV